MATRRTRSILIDATLGKIFVNTDANIPTDPSKLIAGRKLESSTISASSKTKIVPVNNIGFKGVGLPFATGGLLVKVTLSVAIAAVGRSVSIKIRTGTSYQNSIVKTTMSLAENSSKISIPTSITIVEGEKLFIDVVQAGSIKSGFGLSIQLDYYRG